MRGLIEWSMWPITILLIVWILFPLFTFLFGRKKNTGEAIGAKSTDKKSGIKEWFATLSRLSPQTYIRVYLVLWLISAVIFSFLKGEFYHSHLEHEDFFRQCQSKVIEEFYNVITQYDPNQDILHDDKNIYKLSLTNDCKIDVRGFKRVVEDEKESTFSEEKKYRISFTLSCAPALTQNVQDKIDKIKELEAEVKKDSRTIEDWYSAHIVRDEQGLIYIDPTTLPFKPQYSPPYDEETRRQEFIDSVDKKIQQLYELKEISYDWGEMTTKKQANIFNIYFEYTYGRNTQNIKHPLLNIEERFTPFDFPQASDLFALAQEEKLSVAFTPDFYKNLNFYILTQEGIPAGSWLDNFKRMLYLSTAAITTLGYGDIVPVSSLTRWLITLESMLGVVTIGFFLNAVAEKYRRENSSQQNLP